MTRITENAEEKVQKGNFTRFSLKGHIMEGEEKRCLVDLMWTLQMQKNC